MSDSDSLPPSSHPQGFDVSFSVPFVHRLRFTDDVLGADRSVLAELLSPSGGGPARVQFWLDEQVAEAMPDLKARIRQFMAAQSGRLTMPGNVQLVPGGEAVKNDIHIVERMLKCMNAADLDRRSYVVVIGGGAVLDAVGFAAALAHRGIRLVRLPTTTLAQADSGIGVKNAVNLFEQKNWIGTFAVPWGVVNDASLLETLPDRDFRCGFSEAVKVTLLKDADGFAEICRLADRHSPAGLAGGGPRHSPVGRVASGAHHVRGRSVRSTGGSAARLWSLVGSPAGGDDRLCAAARRSGRNRRGDRHDVFGPRSRAADGRCRTNARLPGEAGTASRASGTGRYRDIVCRAGAVSPDIWAAA